MKGGVGMGTKALERRHEGTEARRHEGVRKEYEGQQRERPGVTYAITTLRPFVPPCLRPSLLPSILSPLNVLHINDYRAGGGCEVLVAMMIELLRSRGMQAELFTIDDVPGFRLTPWSYLDNRPART